MSNNLETRIRALLALAHNDPKADEYELMLLAARIGAETEREECAKVADEHYNNLGSGTAGAISREIRARGAL